ncbi:MAG TPA: mannose-1-phosphate guanylyltransferase [Terriglobia bacterium]|nr:mannose-1-phosphate guanylyltransferase [Terriglobia bacterium]
MPQDPLLKHLYAVILAGGSGTRFWPLSRRRFPKQLLELFGRGSLLEQTVARLKDLVPPERIYIFTNQLLHAEICRRFPRIPSHQIVAEPAARNTAPTIGLAAHEVLRRDPDGIMVVLPADQVVTKLGQFRNALRQACRLAETEGISVVIGLKPSRPETGYGYIRVGNPLRRMKGLQIFEVLKFTEKPNLATARRFVAAGDYFWNGGMFIWRATTLQRNLARYQPGMERLLSRIARAGGVRATATLRRLFPRMEKISIDYALMEKIPEIYAVTVDLGWSDVGSWSTVYELRPKDEKGNSQPAQSLCLNSERNLIVADRKFVVAVGVRDLIVVDTDDALLVCAQSSAQDVGKAVQELERRGLKHLL